MIGELEPRERGAHKYKMMKDRHNGPLGGYSAMPERQKEREKESPEHQLVYWRSTPRRSTPHICDGVPITTIRV